MKLTFKDALAEGFLVDLVFIEFIHAGLQMFVEMHQFVHVAFLDFLGRFLPNLWLFLLILVPLFV